MAKIKRNIGELVSGKIGKVVFVQMRGKSYVRAAPDRTRNNWSEAQLLFRARMSAIAALWRSVNCDGLNAAWNLAAKDMNGYAWFIKKNMNALHIEGTQTDPSLIQVMDGSLAVPQLIPIAIGTVTDVPIPEFVQISWENDPHIKKARLSDSLTLISYADREFRSIQRNY